MSEKQKPTSLALMLEDAKREITESINKTIQRTSLPAYLIEGILVGILSDVRNQKNIELIEEMKTISNNEVQQEEGEK